MYFGFPEPERVDFSTTQELLGLGLVGTFGLLSTLSTLILLLYFLYCSLSRSTSWKAFRIPSHQTKGIARFIRGTLGRYFVYLILSDFLQGLAFAANLIWAKQGAIYDGAACTFQGTLEQAGDTGSVFWSLMIAFQTFCLLFLEVRPHPYIELGATIIICPLIVVLPILGSTVFQEKVTRGAFWSFSGAWCWIGQGYQIHRLMYLYIWIFVNLICTFSMYSLIYLKFKGIVDYAPRNLFKLKYVGRPESPISPGSLSAKFPSLQTSRAGTPFSFASNITNDILASDKLLVGIARRLMWYPLVYAIVILPITICRMGLLAGWVPPFGLYITGGIFFTCSGLSNTFLFLFTRHSFIQRRARTKLVTNLPIELTSRFSIGDIHTMTPDPYVLPSPMTMHSERWDNIDTPKSPLSPPRAYFSTEKTASNAHHAYNRPEWSQSGRLYLLI